VDGVGREPRADEEQEAGGPPEEGDDVEFEGREEEEVPEEDAHGDAAHARDGNFVANRVRVSFILTQTTTTFFLQI